MPFPTPIPISLTEQVKAMPKGSEAFFEGASPNTIKVIIHRLKEKNPGKRFKRKAEKNGVRVWRVR